MGNTMWGDLKGDNMCLMRDQMWVGKMCRARDPYLSCDWRLLTRTSLNSPRHAHTHTHTHIHTHTHSSRDVHAPNTHCARILKQPHVHMSKVYWTRVGEYMDSAMSPTYSQHILILWIYIHMYIYKYTYVYIHVYMYKYIYTCMYMYMYLCVCVYVGVYKWIERAKKRE